MLKHLFLQLRTAFIALLALTIITGLIYPLLVTGIAQLFFRDKAEGSLLSYQGQIVASQLIGQNFSDPKYFWPRPSATKEFAYNTLRSGGSNLSPASKEYLDKVQVNLAHYQNGEVNGIRLVPIDLVTASGSGLDPDISPDGAYYQIERVAKARGMSPEILKQLVTKHITQRQLGFLGEPRVNVIELNLALEK